MWWKRSCFFSSSGYQFSKYNPGTFYTSFCKLLVKAAETAAQLSLLPGLVLFRLLPESALSLFLSLNQCLKSGLFLSMKAHVYSFTYQVNLCH